VECVLCQTSHTNTNNRSVHLSTDL